VREFSNVDFGSSRSRIPVRRGFTLVELLVVMAIIGVVVAITLPAVQYSREAARRTHCANNLRNQVLALHQFHDRQQRFPAGRSFPFGHETSWALHVLPYLEQQVLLDRYDWRKSWRDPGGNLAVADAVLSVFRCPSTRFRFAGDSDYGGIMGSMLTSPQWTGSMNNGVLPEIKSNTGQYVTIESVLDGTSQTICLAESADRKLEPGRWISGFNSFSHDNGPINTDDSGEIYSLHASGAFAAFVDGSVRYLVNELDKYVVGAICTRDHGEFIDSSSF
jgi:prepilin-type N-terminal cleavage/methylation domain-containing protein